MNDLFDKTTKESPQKSFSEESNFSSITCGHKIVIASARGEPRYSVSAPTRHTESCLKALLDAEAMNIRGPGIASHTGEKLACYFRKNHPARSASPASEKTRQVDETTPLLPEDFFSYSKLRAQSVARNVDIQSTIS